VANEPIPCPYVGLRPFRESDKQFLFGRDREIRVISSNLQSQPLTVLYGPSGVGKSSVLQAGVLSHLKAGANQAVTYFNEWQSPAFLSELTGKCRRTISSTAVKGEGRLDDVLEQDGRRFFLLLDQFEEFLLYHDEDSSQEFESTLARIVNREDVVAKVLIGIREDALSKFDQRLSIRIPNLLGNTLAVEQLDAAAARDAIRQPLAVLNERYGNTGEKFGIEPELVEEILRQVQAGQVRASESTGLGSATANAGGDRVETVFLQLVLARLWTEEASAGSRTLRMQTLSKIGGAASIVQKHVDAVMAQFGTNRERDIAAAMLRYLVTPSRTKIAQVTVDLISYAEAPSEEVRNVLASLSDLPEARILRRLANPERYEVFHDVLAQPILDWRREYILQKERAAEDERRAAESERQQRELERAQQLALAEQRRAEEQSRSATRLRWMLAAVVVALLLAIVTAIYAFRQRKQAREFAALAEDQRKQAVQARGEAFAAQKQAEADRSKAQAVSAQLQGKTSEAERLRAQANVLTKEADLARNEVSHAKEQSSVAAEGRDKNYRDALQQIADLRKQLDAAETDRKQLQANLKQLQSKLNELQKQGSTPQPQSGTVVQQSPPSSRAPVAVPTEDANTRIFDQKKPEARTIFTAHGFDPLSGTARGSLRQTVLLQIGAGAVIEARNGKLYFGVGRTTPAKVVTCQGLSVSNGNARCVDASGAQIPGCRSVKITGAQGTVTLYTYGDVSNSEIHKFETDLKRLCSER
jgi:hypothetical protein